jgi:pyruvate,orthophosphate dikinase
MTEYPRMVEFGRNCANDVPNAHFGNKAAVLARMASLGVPVPSGFGLNISVCEDFYSAASTLPPDTPGLLHQGISFLERSMGMIYGGTRRPLLVSVRSGAPVSMPGIMETLLNVGLNADTVRGLVFMTGNPRFAWDSYRRFIESFATIVFSQDGGAYRAALRDALDSAGVPEEVELDFVSLKSLCSQYLRIFEHQAQCPFPGDVWEQLELAAGAVLRSWHSPKAEGFRRLNMLEDVRGTGVVVQAMVFGNMGLGSGAGVAFTRNPWTGGRELVVDFKFGAQGEDVVSGAMASTPQIEFCNAVPEVCRELGAIGRKLEGYFGDMQDIEFTVQEGHLYILQSRSGKRGPLAALRAAVELWQEGLIDIEEGQRRLAGLDLSSIRIQKIGAAPEPLATGEPASAGIATGRLVLTANRAEELAEAGPVILVRDTASPDDIPGISVSVGLLAARGARTSHAAVVARQLGAVCIVNCREIVIDIPGRVCRIGETEVREGEVLTLDGTSGRVYAGEVGIEEERPAELLAVVEGWKAGPG